jgi:nitrogen fixation protein NifX
MKVAFATEDMQHVDAHFGWAKNIAIYQISPDSHRFVEAIQFDGDLKEDGSEDKLLPKIDAIRDCAIVYVAAIGGSAAAKVVNAKVHPIKVLQPEPIAELLDRLQKVLQGTPPPWLRKALLKGQERSVNFDDDEEGERHV